MDQPLNRPDNHAQQMSRGGVSAEAPVIPTNLPNGSWTGVTGPNPRVDPLVDFFRPMDQNSGAAS